MNFVIFIAYLLSILRLSYAIVPYLFKFFLFAILRDYFSTFWSHYYVQIMRVSGEVLNLFITSWLFDILFEGKPLLLLFLKLAFIAESIRLLCEKGVMILNGFWQSLPHRAIAKILVDKSQSRIFRHYIRYYLLSDEERALRSLLRLRAKIRLFKKQETEEKIRYVTAFRVLPDKISLRSGNVRDVARGEIYIHAKWLNTPELLHGLALRRSPWIYDPRYLRRPFFYRTEANPLMTKFVFENAQLCPIFAIYQVGHEIKSARYDVFYRIFRRVGIEFEQPVCADGTNNFDAFAKAIMKSRLKLTNCRSLPSDDEVMADMTGKPIPSALEIAEKYTYPLIYVQDVLLPRLLNL